MGLNFNRPDAPTQTAPAAQAELEQVKSYDIVVDRKQMSAELVGSKEVDDIVSTIEVNNLETYRLGQRLQKRSPKHRMWC